MHLRVPTSAAFRHSFHLMESQKKIRQYSQRRYWHTPIPNFKEKYIYLNESEVIYKKSLQLHNRVPGPSLAS